jgi:Immunoglobulin I-set domain
VLGWTPVMAPLILGPPEAVMTGEGGQSMTIRVNVAAVPGADYQWLENGRPIRGATEQTLTRTKVKPAELSRYTVRVRNASGSATSSAAVGIK